MKVRVVATGHDEPVALRQVLVVSIPPLSLVPEGYEVKRSEQCIWRQFVVPTPFLSVYTQCEINQGSADKAK
ncbi:hypothetical protein DIE07_29220 [Burkholderia sp. Bp9002]|nr:hypothetical protein DIE18_21420 [Burkholderia sp. Bp9125]RQS04380.1 hypothetical protein DIE07_29220 [Burkholderia sp. Bp9002]